MCHGIGCYSALFSYKCTRRHCGRENLAPWNIASLKFQDVSAHNNTFPSCGLLSMLSLWRLGPSAWPPLEVCFYQPGQPSHDSAHTREHTYKDTHFLCTYLSWGLAHSVPMPFLSLFKSAVAVWSSPDGMELVLASFFYPDEGLRVTSHKKINMDRMHFCKLWIFNQFDVKNSLSWWKPDGMRLEWIIINC